MDCLIYKIVNTINGKHYIGKTKHTLEKRFKQHIYLAKRNPKTYFHYSLNKYGSENFSILEIEKCNNDNVNERERYWINYFNSFNEGYNFTNGGDGGNTFSLKSLEEKYGENEAKIIWQEYLNKQRVTHIGTNNHFYGKHHTEDTKKLLKEQRIGKTYKEYFGEDIAKEMIKKRSAVLTGKKRTTEQRKRMSDASPKGKNRPNYKNINKEEIISLRNNGLTWSAIAKKLGVTVRTLNKKRKLLLNA